MSRLWVIAYDIADNRRRHVLAEVLASYGERVQESIFEAWITPRERLKLLTAIQQIIKPDSDSVRLYPVSDPTQTRCSVLGAMPATSPDPSFWSF